MIERSFRCGALPGRRAFALVPLVAGGFVALLVLVSASLESPIANAMSVNDQLGHVQATHPRTPRVLLVGDSAAATLAPGIAEAVKSDGVQLASGTVAGCALDWDVEQMRDRGGPWIDAPQGDVCRWPRTWPRLMRRYHPDLVLVNFGIWDMQDHRVGQHVFVVGTPAWRGRMERRAAEALAVARHGGARVGVVLSAALLSGVRPLNDLLRGVARREHVPVLDLVSIVPNSTAYRWDGVHYTRVGAHVVGAKVGRWAERLIRPPR